MNKKSKSVYAVRREVTTVLLITKVKINSGIVLKRIAVNRLKITTFAETDFTAEYIMKVIIHV